MQLHYHYWENLSIASIFPLCGQIVSGVRQNRSGFYQKKDGRYRYEISDFRMKYFVSASQYTRPTDVDMALEDWNKGRDSNNKKFYPKIDTQVKAMIESLGKAMKTQTDDNW